MAAVTHRVNTPSTSNVSTYTSGSFTPAANELLVVAVTASGTRIDTGAGTATLTDSQGLGFTLIDTALKASSADTLYLFVANNLAAASSMTVTFDCTGDAATGAIIDVCGVSGMDRLGIDAVRQTAKQSNRAASTTPAPAFASSALTGNPTLGWVAITASPPSITEPTGWTEQFDNTGYSTPSMGIEVVSRDSGFTGTTVTWGSAASATNCALIVELDTSNASADPPYYIGNGTVGTAASGNPTGLGMASGWAAGDLGVIEVVAADNVAVTATGWTVSLEQNQTTTLRITILTRLLQVGDTAPTINHSGGSAVRARMFAFRRADLTTPVDTISANGTSASATATSPNVTPASTPTAVVFLGGEELTANTSGVPAWGAYSGTYPTFNEIGGGNFEGGANSISAGVAWGGNKAATAMGARTATITGEAATPTANIVAILVIKGQARGGTVVSDVPRRRSDAVLLIQ